MIGTKLAIYEITSHLGTGGMGEVYQATDSKLGRSVAIKLLPEAFTHDHDRAARFEREARVLAALNHPNIATIHGVEESGGRKFLVMELVGGETLAERIKRGAIPVDEALGIARQICEALEAAHEKGIVHRDLKPANVKITAEGKVKVLDFGLAKAFETQEADSGLSNSPTLSMAATNAGVILGTAAYMSPEQAKGRAIDKRTDIFSFGAVLYEMLSGQRAFDGEDMVDVLGAVARLDPNWDALAADVPQPVRAVLMACLVKDRRKRVADIAAVLFVLDQLGKFSPQPSRRPLWRRAAPAAAALLAGSILTGIVVWRYGHLALPAPRLARFELPLQSTETLAIAGNDHDIAISPDGTRVVYKVTVAGQPFLVVRAMDELTARPLQGLTQNVFNPFISPDSAWVGFSDEGDGTLKKVSILGGPAVRICLTGAGSAGIVGASWGNDETIVFGTSAPSGLWRVAAGGGMPKEITKLAQGQSNHAWPELLPGSQAVLFTILNGTGAENAQIAVLNLVTGVQKVLVPGGSYPRYSPTGHIVYGIGGTLRAVPFDLRRLEVTGSPVPVLDRVLTKDTVSSIALGAADFALARDGSLVYLSGSGIAGGAQRTLVWVDRQGRETPITAPPNFYLFPRLSPDGTRVAVYSAGQEQDVWVWDLGRTTLTRATFDPRVDSLPVWTLDSRRLIFSSERTGVLNLYWQASDGTGAVERLTDSSNSQISTAVSPDGHRLIFTESTPKMGDDIMQVDLDGTHKVTPLVQSSFNDRNGIVSPDGRWLAYEANDSGRYEIYVRPYPDVNSGHWQVSTAGGTRPLWARNGQELFYASLSGAVMRIGVERSATWVATPPTILVKEGYVVGLNANSGRTYDVAPDGQRFLMVKNVNNSDSAAGTPKIIVVQHWTEELKRLAPTR